MGHALDNTLQDILIRWRRMQGYCTLWLPGTDHASIATEAKIVAAMQDEGLTKDDVGREGFLERAWAWRDKYGARIVEQLKKLGSSCDWQRERFTLDEGCNKAVNKVFIDLYNKGLIYRGAVSYTHLDVYKRQAAGRAGNSGRRAAYRPGRRGAAAGRSDHRPAARADRQVAGRNDRLAS